MLDVLTIGTATRDVFLRSPFFKVVRDPKHLRKIGFPTGEAQCFALGAKIQLEAPVFAVGGVAANSAVTFARQGFRAGALIGIGRDENGRAALAHLTKEGVKVFPVTSRSKMTGYSVILLSPDGERTILHHRGASQDIKAGLPRLRCRWAYIGPAGIPLGVMLKIVGRLEKNKVKIAMNPSSEYLKLGAKKLKPLLSKLDVIMVNREEAAYLTGMPYDNERRIFRKFDEWVKGIAVMTEGEKGVLVSDGKRIYRAGIFREKKVADRTGAGDAFGSGFVSGLIRRQWSMVKGQRLSEEDIKYAIRLGSANATSVVEQVGAQAGILRRRQSESPRWQNLPVKITGLK
ncbi:MAG: carbohydrate kinase family protein [Patescibacteria group bacterium]